MKSLSALCIEDRVVDIVNTVDGGNFPEICKQWWGSKFKRIRVSSSAKLMGLVGEEIVKTIVDNMNDNPFSNPTGNECDIKVGNKRVEIKTSFKSVAGTHGMCQVRTEADIDYILFLCIASDDTMRMFRWNKEDMIKARDNGLLNSNLTTGDNKNNEIYCVSGNIDRMKKDLNMREYPSLLKHISTEEISDIIKMFEHNNDTLKKHMAGTIWEPIAYNAVKIGFLGKHIIREIFSNFGISAKIMYLKKDLCEVNGGGDLVDVKTSIIGSDGKFRLCQVRPKSPFKHLYFVALFENDARVFKCSREDVMNACANGKISNHHNNYKGNGKSGLFSSTGTLEDLIEKFNFVEQ